MKTLAVTAARQKLGYWLKRGLDGEDIGILIDGEAVRLRPARTISADYALREYGLGQRESGEAAKRIAAGVRAARHRGETRRFTGSADELAPARCRLTVDFAGNQDEVQAYLRGR